ncbi:hypothetical protein E2C01_029027 [Portunus trituberculatus]|uniref:Uncharacterized protein n=1 Tax=Portunus trituberculatus TaxID=210409 RepID=A0A5B7EM99_PORTR|nr:hypothetical protein [Portunus trituberculatus]
MTGTRRVGYSLTGTVTAPLTSARRCRRADHMSLQVMKHCGNHLPQRTCWQMWSRREVDCRFLHWRRLYTSAMHRHLHLPF